MTVCEKKLPHVRAPRKEAMPHVLPMKEEVNAMPQNMSIPVLRKRSAYVTSEKKQCPNVLPQFTARGKEAMPHCTARGKEAMPQFTARH
ncbi:hypothetical protein AVEN_59864-1 [Araneus ventricosus]|uniref:Uncharacterized protein n=1 Tax=Araneus ventricosus TaxID=182803 RepID=A0A4Y2FER3_ARAVE|nr:hypothetical protein AVEN_59864-1 [Araneus ventricosus]